MSEIDPPSDELAARRARSRTSPRNDTIQSLEDQRSARFRSSYEHEEKFRRAVKEFRDDQYAVSSGANSAYVAIREHSPHLVEIAIVEFLAVQGVARLSLVQLQQLREGIDSILKKSR